MRVTVNAFKSSEVSDYVMARGAGVPYGTMSAGIDREISAVMIPGRRRPCRCAVADLTVSRKHLAGMIRANGAGITRLVARVTGCCGANVSGSVAGNAGCREMRAS